MQRILILAFLLVMTVACGHKRDAQSFEKALEASSGHDFTIVKLQTNVGKYVVYKDEVTGRYSAYNMDKWDRKTMKTTNEFYANAVAGVDAVLNLEKVDTYVEDGYNQDIYEYYTVYEEYYDESCDCYYTEEYTYSEYVGTEWVDTSYWVTTYQGGGFVFENTAGQSKDLETMAAMDEEVGEKFMAHRLTSEFSLSESRASELAKLMNRYQKLENSRELTASEKDKFALDALGVSYSQIEKALKAKAEGKEEAYESLLAKASEVNKATPEQIGKVFEELLEEDSVE